MFSKISRDFLRLFQSLFFFSSAIEIISSSILSSKSALLARLPRVSLGWVDFFKMSGLCEEVESKALFSLDYMPGVVGGGNIDGASITVYNE